MVADGRNAIDFVCWFFSVLILYPATLLNSLINSIWISFGVATHAIISLANTDVLVPFQSNPIQSLYVCGCHLLDWLKFPLLYWLGLLRAGILALFLILRGMLSTFQHYCDVWCRIFEDVLYQVMGLFTLISMDVRYLSIFLCHLWWINFFSLSCAKGSIFLLV